MKLRHRSTVEKEGLLVDYLAAQTGLSKIRIKKALTAGALVLERTSARGAAAKPRRVRRNQYVVRPGDRLDFHFDDNALLPPPELPFALFDTPHYGLWFKPVNVLSQASPSGDLSSMERLVADIRGGGPLHMVNRVDREASGIVAVAYHPEAAARLSAIWKADGVEKIYQLEVRGAPSSEEGVISRPLDGRRAVTRWSCAGWAKEGRTTFVRARIETGRHHQIRRHFAAIGHPVMGDPRYGEDNADPRGLRLVSSEVRFICPYSRQEVHVTVPAERLLFG